MNEVGTWPFFWKVVKFGIVGGSGVFIDFGITYLLKEKLHTNKYLANTVGFFCAASSNYIFNRIWTFHSEDPEMAWQYFKFILLSGGGAILSNIIIYVLNEKFKLNFYVAKVVAIAIVMFWNFFGSLLFAFSVK